MKKFFLTLALVCVAWGAMAATDTLRVLSVANSFGVDAVEQNLYEIALADGHVYIIGNLYIGGCSLERHFNNAKSGKKAYSYRKVAADGAFTTREKTSLPYAFKDEPWDVVVFQQASHYSGLIDTYEPYLGELIKYARKCTGKDTKFYIHQTWAYANDATHDSFPTYDRNQTKMFEALTGCYRQMAEKYGLGFIPSGTAIQNARQTFIRDNVTRDGYHLSWWLGRYIAAATYYEALSGNSVVDNAWTPPHLDADRIRMARLCAHAAVEKPYEVTNVDDVPMEGYYGTPQPYTLPDPLKMEDGTPITTAEQWYSQRRPELMELFTREMFGRAPERPELSYIVTEEGPALDGKAVRKQVDIKLSARRVLHLLVYLPAGVDNAPAFLGVNFNGNHTIIADPAVQKHQDGYGVYPLLDRGANAGRWPVEEIIGRGYAVATFHCSDVDPDYDDGRRNGVTSLIFRKGQNYPDPDQWGSLAQWAWGLSCALDYLEADPSVDGTRVAVLGHSRMGKAALWAGASDPRFAMVISNESGCGGAALSRRAIGETVFIINSHFPHWFCDNFKKYNKNESALPLDQHELLACIAPRPVYVASAEGDKWSDPVGERLSFQEAAKVYHFLGLPTDLMGYHIREGRHAINQEDWQHYLDFADLHFGRA